MDVHEQIEQIAQRYLKGVKQTGSENLMAFCPFHTNVNSPSFTMSLTKGLYFCFSCKAKGSLRTFLKHMGVSPLMLQAGYKALLDAIDLEAPQESLEKKTQQAIRPANIFASNPLPEELLGLFEMCPESLLAEGFTEEVLQRFDVGFDKNHMRITFPLRDLNGRLMGIFGRTVVGDRARYKLYDYEFKSWGLPQRRTDKEAILWNADKVYPEIQLTGARDLVLVEGFKGAIWLEQAGFPRVVSSMGSYLSAKQRWILERLGATVYVMYDNDDAGYRGRDYAGAALADSLPVKIVEFDKEKHQPTDLTVVEVQDAIFSATDYAVWSIRRTEGKERWPLAKTRRC